MTQLTWDIGKIPVGLPLGLLVWAYSLSMTSIVKQTHPLLHLALLWKLTPSLFYHDYFPPGPEATTRSKLWRKTVFLFYGLKYRTLCICAGVKSILGKEPGRDQKDKRIRINFIDVFITIQARLIQHSRSRGNPVGNISEIAFA